MGTVTVAPVCWVSSAVDVEGVPVRSALLGFQGEDRVVAGTIMRDVGLKLQSIRNGGGLGIFTPQQVLFERSRISEHIGLCPHDVVHDLHRKACWHCACWRAVFSCFSQSSKTRHASAQHRSTISTCEVMGRVTGGIP